MARLLSELELELELGLDRFIVLAMCKLKLSYCANFSATYLPAVSVHPHKVSSLKMVSKREMHLFRYT